MKAPRVNIWRDGLRRVCMTPQGPLVIEPGETAMLVVGKDIERAIAAIGRALGIENIEEAASYYMEQPK